MRIQRNGQQIFLWYFLIDVASGIKIIICALTMMCAKQMYIQYFFASYYDKIFSQNTWVKFEHYGAFWTLISGVLPKRTESKTKSSERFVIGV